MKWFWRLTEAIVFTALLWFWTCMACHYGGILADYAAKEYHIIYPTLYIAVESWLLLSLLVVTLLLVKLIGMVHTWAKA